MSPAYNEQYLGPSTEGPFIFVCLVVSIRFQYIKGVRIYFSSMFKLEGGWMGQTKSERCSNCEKRTN